MHYLQFLPHIEKKKNEKGSLRSNNKLSSKYFSISMVNIGIIGNQNKTKGRIQMWKNSWRKW